MLARYCASKERIAGSKFGSLFQLPFSEVSPIDFELDEVTHWNPLIVTPWNGSIDFGFTSLEADCARHSWVTVRAYKA